MSENKAEEIKFPKEQIVEMRKYKNRTDLLNALLEDGMEYSHDDVDKIINKFMKGVI